MKRQATISIFRYEQPTPDAWDAALRFADAWNAAHEPKLELLLDALLRAFQVNMDTPEYRALSDALSHFQKESGADILESTQDILEDADFAQADFLWVMGVCLDSDTAEFVWGGDRGPPVPCAKCGSAGPWSRPQRAEFIVNEGLLDGPATDGEKQLSKVPGGWDFVNLPAGLAVSARAIACLKELGASGWTLRPILSAATHKPSSRVEQLVALSCHTVPCLEHLAEPIDICPACGVVHEGTLGENWPIRESEVGDEQIWSSDPQRTVLIYMARTLFEALIARGLHGLIAAGTCVLCKHHTSEGKSSDSPLPGLPA